MSKINALKVKRPYLYSRCLYIALCAIPGPLVAAVLIEVKSVGRTRAGTAIAFLTGLFMLLTAVSKSRNAALAFECILGFLHFDGLAVQTLYTVEIVPTTTRGFGLGVMGFTWGLFGLIAYIITTFDADLVSGGGPVCFVVLFGSCCLRLGWVCRARRRLLRCIVVRLINAGILWLGEGDGRVMSKMKMVIMPRRNA